LLKISVVVPFFFKQWGSVHRKTNCGSLNEEKWDQIKVDAHLVIKHYEKGKKISNKQMASLKIKRHEIFPNWNYTLLA